MAEIIGGKQVREGDLVTVVDRDVSVTGVVSHIVGYEFETEICIGEDMSTFFTVPRNKKLLKEYDVVVVRLVKAPKPAKEKKGKKK